MSAIARPTSCCARPDSGTIRATVVPASGDYDRLPAFDFVEQRAKICFGLGGLNFACHERAWIDNLTDYLAIVTQISNGLTSILGAVPFGNQIEAVHFGLKGGAQCARLAWR